MTGSPDKWGFRPEKSNLIDLDTTGRDLYRQIVKITPGIQACFFCGSCGSTCTVSRDGMNFRHVHLLLSRGELQKLEEIIAPCLLCGKCTLVCPRNVDTRSVIYNLKILLHEYI